MERWAQITLPEKFTWIEETFADRERRKRGNLRERGKTLLRIANYFDGAPTATRTLQPAVIYSTLRDAGNVTSLFIGTDGVGQEFSTLAKQVGTAPDTRTVMVIGDLT